jgi:hypothetical protein
MDDETRQAFADLKADLMKLMNDQHKRLIAQMNRLARDFQNTQSFLIEEVSGAESRLDDLEKKP